MSVHSSKNNQPWPQRMVQNEEVSIRSGDDIEDEMESYQVGNKPDEMEEIPSRFA